MFINNSKIKYKSSVTKGGYNLSHLYHKTWCNLMCKNVLFNDWFQDWLKQNRHILTKTHVLNNCQRRALMYILIPWLCYYEFKDFKQNFISNAFHSYIKYFLFTCKHPTYTQLRLFVCRGTNLKLKLSFG